VRLNGIGGSNFTITGSSFITITNDDFVFGLP
jgi:hypothetical protein